MRRARDNEVLLWDDHIYRRVGHRGEIELLTGPKKLSGFMAKVELTVHGHKYEPGQEIRVTGLPDIPTRSDISVAFLDLPDWAALLERGHIEPLPERAVDLDSPNEDGTFEIVELVRDDPPATIAEALDEESR